VGINAHSGDELSVGRTEEDLIKLLFDQQGAIVAQVALAAVGVVVAADVQFILPAQVQGHDFDGLAIGQVVQLLEDEGADGRVEIFAGAAEGVSEMGGERGEG
jgi:hypothetical protein